MANADKSLKIQITGDSTQLGAATRQAVSQLNEVKSAALSMLAGFTGGLLGGGVAGTVTAVVNMVATQIRDARQLLADARSLEVSPSFLKGAKKAGDLLFQNENVIPAAIDNAAQARSNAIFGDPAASAALARLGLTGAGVAGLSKEDLFQTLIKAFREGPDTRDRRASLAEFFGMAQANQMLPYIVGNGGKQMDFGQFIQDRANDIYTPWFGLDALRKNTDAQFRGEVEPISLAGMGNEKKLQVMREELAQRENANRRATLSVEEQINEVILERARLIKEMNATSDEERKLRLRADIIGLDSELIGLRKRGDGSAGATLRNATTAADQFAQLGMFIGGGRGMSIAERQLTRLDSIEKVLMEQRNENTRNWA